MISGVEAHHVLLIEEDPKEIEIHGDLIRHVANCKVDVMSHVENSIDWIARSNYHLIIIDEALNGLILLERIKRMSPNTSVILISGQATVEHAVAAIRLGAEDYLQKPVPLDSLKLAVKRGLDRKVIFAESTGASHFLSLLNSCQMISASFDQEKIFGIVKSYFSRELKSEYCAIFSVIEGKVIRFIDHQLESPADRAMQEVLDIAIQASNPLAQMIESGEFYQFIDRGQLTLGLFIFRFSCAGKEDYFCVCLSPQRPVATEFFEARLKMLKAQIEVTARNIQQFQGVQDLVYVDDVTGLYNTRYLHYVLDREITQAKLNSRSFAVLFIDADQFKSINDKYGHLVGSKLLNELGNHCRKFVREKDAVFRYGGDEFVAVLSNCDLATAHGVAERIRRSIEEEGFLRNEGLDVHFTVTIGVALFPDHASSKQEIIDAADQAMYGAKRTCRNSVLIAHSSKGSKRGVR